MTEKTQLLLIEDDVRLASLVSDYLENQNFQVMIQHRGDRAVAEFKSDTTDIVIVDLMLPGLDGLQVCQQLRKVFVGPILILTAKNSDIDHVMGLELGADDFVTKPIEPPVLLARLRALIRRTKQIVKQGAETAPVTKLHFASLRINYNAQQVYLNEQSIELTTQEFDLLWLLANNAGVILSRDQIFSQIRGIDYDGMDRTVDVRISQLRKKLHDSASKPKRLKTVWGKGYLFVADAWE